jgi:zinc transport system substrate-binding protein
VGTGIGFIVKKIVFSFFILLFAIAFSGCQKKTSTPAQYSTNKILISVAPYRFFIEKIAGDAFEVICLVPKGTNPHLYETPPRLVEEALQAKIWFRLGEPMEKKFVDLFAKRAPGMQIVNLNENLELIDEPTCCNHHDHSHQESADLHTWLSPQLVEQQVQQICVSLCNLFPEQAPLFRERLTAFCQELKQLDGELVHYFQEHPTPHILISHPSLGYFCRDYHIEQLSLEIEGKEPLPRDLLSLLDKAKAKNIRQILIQPQHEARGAERIAKELDLSIKMIDPYDENYLANLRQIAKTIGS